MGKRLSIYRQKSYRTGDLECLDFGFVVPDGVGLTIHPGDTLEDINGKVWVVLRYHWSAGNDPVIVVAPSMRE